MRVAIKFAYDGRIFYGYARQPKLQTVEGELINSLIKLGIIKDTKESNFKSASRTDKYVSALGNVVSFNTKKPIKDILQILSNESKLIIFFGIKKVEPEFNPRFAKLRQYRYYLKINNLNIEKIISTASCFTGEHDFTKFTKLESFRNPIRNIENIVFTMKDDLMIIDFYAQTFLWHQIRKIMSALIKVGSGKLEKKEILDALNKPDKQVDFGLASAYPLILVDIFYNFKFKYEKNNLIKSINLKKIFLIV